MPTEPIWATESEEWPKLQLITEKNANNNDTLMLVWSIPLPMNSVHE